MKFYYVATENKYDTADLFDVSCKERGIETVRIDPDTYSYTDGKDMTKKDLLYRIGISAPAIAIEKVLLQYSPTTFYSDEFLFPRSVHLAYKQANIPVPKTVSYVSSNKELLRSSVEHVGGLPVVIKVVGGSKGIGVMLADSYEGLFSIVDFLSSRSIRFVLQEFIDAPSHARLIVLGNKVIDSIEYISNAGDFRTNSDDTPNVAAKKFSKEVEEIAIEAAHALGVEFGGTDIIFDKKGNPYVLEVNSPCYFPRCQMTTGVDISGMMVDYLVKKSKER
ncbi:MAG: ATP-grasp domain-containing protein [Candidatus Jacksonbacteria bacterium]|jgi:carbamoylphosphate synthase large subunit|nr:ATP-grasp domain-containing protein [Candidatus Jacksonbacteria bacterium]MBT7007832.1 ATP-grasp domain-containing protein [Candidatus Jacksonbacteria bacterium]